MSSGFEKMRRRRILVRRVLACVLVTVVAFTLLFSARVDANYGSAAGGERKAIMRIGKSYIGTPYSQMNCSQFTSTVYGKATGVYMPADYVAQRSYGRTPARLKKGDLLTYKDHVGIYAGNGQILHSSTYFGSVVVSETKYLHGYLGARRIR